MHILFIEDSVVEANLLMEALRNSPLPARMSVVSSGDAVLAYLRQQGEYRRVTRPNLILWSLSGPVSDLLPTLYELHNDSTLSVIPVVILGNTRSSTMEQSPGQWSNVQVVPKPIGAHDYMALVNEIATWCQPTVRTSLTHDFIERDTTRELLSSHGVVSLSRETRGIRNKAKERASIS